MSRTTTIIGLTLILMAHVSHASNSTSTSTSTSTSNSTSTADEPTPTGSPITREQLAAIMKHPTEPNFDPLRPLSGRWVRCAKNESGEGSVQDRFSSTDHDHFTHTLSIASDDSCRAIVSEERRVYGCENSARDELSCRLEKREAKVTGGTWAVLKETGADVASAIRLKFVGLAKRVRTPKRRAKPSKPDLAKGIVSPDDRKLEIRLAPEGAAAESIHLEFAPSVPHAKK